MTRFDRSIPPSYFDDMYAVDPDPWRFAESDYERDKYAATLAALPRERYARGLEVGCSIGVLTRQLAGRCESLLSIDVAETALRDARARCADRPNVRFERRHVPAEWPDGRFDLVLLSEVVYYLDRDDVVALARRVAAAAPGGDVLLVHWLGETHYPLSGDEATDTFVGALPASEVIAARREAAYRLDVLRLQDLRLQERR